MRAQYTPIGEIFKNSLQAINDQVWLVDMMSYVFGDFLDSVACSDQSLVAKDILPKYKDATRLNYNVIDLSRFHDERRHLHLSYFLISAYECAEDYVEQIHVFLGKYCDIQVVQKNKLSIEDRVKGTFAEALQVPSVTVDKILQTLKYFRLLRNALAHEEGEFKGALSSFAKSSGVKLNGLWRKHESQEITHSFSEGDARQILTARNSAALIHFLRILISDLDAIYAPCIDLDHVFPIVLDEAWKNNPSKQRDVEVIVRKVQRLLELKFGMECAEDEVRIRIRKSIGAL